MSGSTHPRWPLTAQSSSQNPSIPSWPTRSAGLQSWAWCWSGWPEDSPLRRWCSSHWHCEGCSPRSERATHTPGKGSPTFMSRCRHFVYFILLTSPRWESPSGPRVSGFTIITRTPGSICGWKKKSFHWYTWTTLHNSNSLSEFVLFIYYCEWSHLARLH